MGLLEGGAAQNPINSVAPLVSRLFYRLNTAVASAVHIL